MAYSSRHTNRRKQAVKKKVAIARAKREHGDTMRRRYYLTKVKRACRCSACGGKLRVKDDMVFRKDGPVTLHVRCADADPLVEYRPSWRWERERPRGRQP
jgi:hypothetical protein